MEKIIAIQLGLGSTGAGVKASFYPRGLEKHEGFTTNIDYIGHDVQLLVPVYINEKLKAGEIKEIMENKEFKTLPEGNYKAVVRQVFDKQNDKGQIYRSIELQIDGQDEYSYIGFCLDGYDQVITLPDGSSKTLKELNEEKIEKILDDFDMFKLDQLVNQEVNVSAVANKKGIVNLFLHPVKQYMNWVSDCELACVIDRITKGQGIGKDGNPFDKYMVHVKIKSPLDGKTYDDCAAYYMNSQFDPASFDKVLWKCGLTKENCVNARSINKPAKFNVKIRTVEKDGQEKTYINKKIFFERQAPQKTFNKVSFNKEGNK